MNEHQVKAFNMAAPGLPDGEKLGDTLKRIAGQFGGGAVINIGDEEADKIAVSVQLTDANGDDLSGAHLVLWWLSDDPGEGFTSSAPDSGVSVIAGIDLAAIETNKAGQAITDKNGTLILELEESGDVEWYLNVNVNGKIVSSDVIAFES